MNKMMMKSRFLLLLIVFSLSIFISSLVASELGFCNEEMALPGGVRDVPANQNSGEVESLARFAVDEHNKKEVPISVIIFDFPSLNHLHMRFCYDFCMIQSAIRAICPSFPLDLAFFSYLKSFPVDAFSGLSLDLISATVFWG